MDDFEIPLACVAGDVGYEPCKLLSSCQSDFVTRSNASQAAAWRMHDVLVLKVWRITIVFRLVACSVRLQSKIWFVNSVHFSLFRSRSCDQFRSMPEVYTTFTTPRK